MTEQQEKLWKTLLEIKELFDRVDCPFFLIGGTLLGAVRDGDIIPWDRDIDIGVFEKDEKLLEKVFETAEKEGWHLHDWFFGSVGRMNSLCKGHRAENNYCDVFVFYDYGDIYWLIWVNSQCQVFPKEFVENPIQITMKGVMFLVPHFPEKYLERQYGNLWRSSLKGWKDGSLTLRNELKNHDNSNSKNKVKFPQPAKSHGPHP